MTREVLLKIQGLQIAQDDSNDTVEVITPGRYYYRRGKHYFLYEEVMEGLTETTNNMIIVADNYMELRKSGAVNVHMVFEKNRPNVSYYYTPYGSLQVGIDAGKVEMTETENEIGVEVIYGLEINNEHMANCRIVIHVSPRRQEGFQLMP